MFKVPEQYRVNGGPGTLAGWFRIPYCHRPQLRKAKVMLAVIASNGQGWEHVSVSLPNRAPIWSQMCFVKDLFWDEEDTVVQYHPAKSEYVNVHPYCLHMWRPTNAEIVKPPPILVGPKSLNQQI